MELTKLINNPLLLLKSNVTIDNLDARERKLHQLYIISLLLILIVALITRIYVTFISGLSWFSSDSYDYLNMAEAIFAGHPYAKFPNGIPILIAMVRFFFNPKVLSQALVSLNIILSTLVVLLTINITKQISGSRLIGILAGAIIAFYPNQINYVRQILSEVPTSFFLTLSIFVFLKKKYFFSGLILFIATMCRTDLLFVLPLLFICSLFYFGRMGKARKAVYYLVGYGLGIVLYSMLLHLNVVSSTNRYGLEILKSIVADSLQENYPGISSFSSEEIQHPIQTYVKYAVEHPIEYTKQRLAALENMWGWAPSPSRSLHNKIFIAIRFPIFILAMLAFYKQRKKFDVWVVLIPIFALTILHVITYSSPRYTFTVEPLLISLACIFFSRKIYLQSEASKV